MEISIVIPVYNSCEILPNLISEIDKNLSKKNFDFEVFLINDFSKDNSWGEIKELSKKFKFIKGINLKDNYGQHNAIIAGLNFCKGNFVILMDDDMQHDPKYIIEIYNELKKDFDICYVRYLKRKHIFWKKFVSWLNNIISSVLAFKSLKIYTSSFKGFNKKVCSEIKKFKKKEVFLDWLILKQSKKVSIIKIVHQERYKGKTNYNLKNLFNLWSIMIINISPINFIHKILCSRGGEK